MTDISRGAVALRAHQWKPGQSGNPTGRPKVIAALRDLARDHTETAVETLVAIMRDARAPWAVRVAAAAHILDRGYGKPTLCLEAVTKPLSSMSDEELEAIVRECPQAQRP